jgi:hypothetical protein
LRNIRHFIFEDVYNIFSTFYLCITNLNLFREVVSPLRVYSDKEVHEKLNQPTFQYIVCFTVGFYNAIIRNLPSRAALYADLEGERAVGF